VRLSVERRDPEGGGVSAELQLGDAARFFPSDAALASWQAQDDQGNAVIVYE
jgi:DNA polymerase-3 subunit alpha